MMKKHKLLLSAVMIAALCAMLSCCTVYKYNGESESLDIAGAVSYSEGAFIPAEPTDSDITDVSDSSDANPSDTADDYDVLRHR